MKAKDIVKLVGIYAAIFIVCFFIFVGLFHTPLLAGMNVLMYRGLVFVVLAGLVAAGAMAVIRKFWDKIVIRDIIMMFTIFCCVTTVFFTLIPVTVERSVSVFTLSYMDENDDRSFSKDEIAEVFTQKYVIDYGAFDKRFDEQLATGTVKENADGTFEITPKGKKIVKMFRLMSAMFDTDERLVYPNENEH